MSANLIQSLAQVLKSQQRLNEIALEKTELLKKNEVKKLEELLKKEELEIHLLEQTERKRLAAVTEFMNQNGIEAEDTTMSALLPYLTGNDKERFEKLQMKLVEELVELKERNELNEQLTKQSLYFVNASLAMLSPEETTAMTYQRPNNKKQEQGRQSIFDSKA